ncbi:ABC transporter ATP-binding protein [Candidatus Thiothrix sp. Deng01]|uniref:ABC transporter ATP-binding protein n=1 Tax=Candidatus Thiothrix phosphatis TaxID=3112415 RepID=A0ABU6CZU7_9GAMM|nr:ABC transporter ATP-binding protein [Candidatus Thiothrix sp. Deng01]MEB4591577.1 ABC transporter ATP-binding protein [Candidatus Thiothrix sp. Deng01]
MSKLTLQNIHIAYGDNTVVHDISLSVEDGQIGCLLGPSGCGKTTLLRAMAGFEPVTQGTITLKDQIISAPGTHLPPEKRNIGMVFQDYALFPHLTITDNISFGIRKQSAREKAQRVMELLELVDLPGYEKRYPHELSGGQQQRIALARALAPRPRLLLLDEPFGSQDVELREMLAREVRDILKREGMTAVLVTHDQHEAFAMADEIGVLQAGHLQQWDTAYNLYHQPANQFVAGFIGQGALLAGTVMDGNAVMTVLGAVQGDVPEACPLDSPVAVLIRPDAVKLAEDAPYQATVLSQAFRGAEYLYTLELGDGSRILALAPSRQPYALGDNVSFGLDAQRRVILPNDAGAKQANPR